MCFRAAGRRCLAARRPDGAEDRENADHGDDHGDDHAGHQDSPMIMTAAAMHTAISAQTTNWTSAGVFRTRGIRARGPAHPPARHRAVGGGRPPPDPRSAAAVPSARPPAVLPPCAGRCRLAAAPVRAGFRPPRCPPRPARARVRRRPGQDQLLLRNGGSALGTVAASVPAESGWCPSGPR